VGFELQVVVPEYVPLSAAAETVAVPELLVVQPLKAPSNPPLGIVSANVNVLPATLPVTEPRPVTVCPFADAVAVTLPFTEAPDCVSVNVNVPVPDESDADPLQVPLTEEGVSGAAGVEAVVPLVQPMRGRARPRLADRSRRRRKRSTAIQQSSPPYTGDRTSLATPEPGMAEC